MTIITKQRLTGICEMIVQERLEDDPDAVMTFTVPNDYQAVITTRHMEAVLTVIRAPKDKHNGQIEVEFAGADKPGDIRLMYINAAMWPEGDFQVAETIGDQLA